MQATFERMDRAHLGRPEPPEGLRVVKAQGSFVIDQRGRKRIDFFAGWCVGNLGWAQRDIKARLKAFSGPDYVAPSYQYGPWAELAAALADLAPGKLKRSFRAVGGTEAVEIALQAAQIATGRKRFAAIKGGYHGNSLGARLPNAKRIKPPLVAAALPDVKAALDKHDVAAFIMEPVVCNLGVLVPSEEFMIGLEALCRRYGTLLVMDEVATGFGRTGRIFATEHYGIEPDIMCLAKAITGGHAPMGATLMTEEIADKVDEEMGFYSTYGWHPLSVEAALATVHYMGKHGTALMREVAARSRQFEERLGRMDFPGGDADVRVKGLAIAIELASEEDADEIVERCLEEGLLVTNDEETLQIFPALNIGKGVVDKGLDVLERVTQELS